MLAMQGRRARRRERDRSSKGFTLIELLIVIVVLGILAAIVIFSLTGVSGESQAAACTSNGKTVEIAADAYQAESGKWPTSTSQLVGKYLKSWPSSSAYAMFLGTNNVLVAIPTTNTNTVPYGGTTGCTKL